MSTCPKLLKLEYIIASTSPSTVCEMLNDPSLIIAYWPDLTLLYPKAIHRSFNEARFEEDIGLSVLITDLV